MQRSLPMVLTALALTGCSKDGNDGETTWADVAPIFEARCSSCHQDGGIGTFSIETYEGAKAYSGLIRSEVVNRTMPPWLVTSDGTCGEFVDSQWLTDDEIATISDWVDAGAPEGAESVTISPVAPQTLAQRDLTFTTPEIVPERVGDVFALNDEYRCFAWENPTDSDVFITGYEVEPGNPAIVHHVLGMPVGLSELSVTGNTTNADEIAIMDGADGRPGWRCLGTAGGDIQARGIPITWAPGQGGVTWGDDIGVRLGAGDVMVFQVHYNLADALVVGQSDSSTIHLRVADSVQSEAYAAIPDPFLFSMFDFPDHERLPPGESATEFTWEMDADTLLYYALIYGDHSQYSEVSIHGVMPHMHGMGIRQRFEVIRKNGTEECASDVQNWDYNWELMYMYEEPLRLELDDVLRVTCTYDTTSVDHDVLPGWGTQNEMCLNAMILTVE